MQSSNFKYARRPGTSDLGREYEIKILTFLSLRCLRNKQEDFWFLFNAEGVGDFDDVILHYEDNTFLLQLKHKEKQKVISQSEFLTSRQKDFYLKSYFEDVYNLKNNLASYTKNNKNENCCSQLGSFNKIYFILYTNRNVNLDGTCDFLVKSHDEDEVLSILNSGGNLEAFRFDAAKLQGKFNLKNLDYIDNFYLLPNQIHVKDLDREINQEIEKITKVRDPKAISENFVKYITKWCKGDVGKDYSLTKQDIASKLTELLCDQYAPEKLFHEPYNFYECEKKLLWNDIIRDKTVTVIDINDNEEIITYFISEYLGSEVKNYCELTERKNWSSYIPKKNKTLFYTNRDDCKFQMLKQIGDRDKVSLSDIYKCLCNLNKLPIVVEVNKKDQYKHVLNVLHLSNFNHKVIVINKTKEHLTSNEIESLLEHLGNLPEKHKKVILQQEVKLQGRRGARLEDLINENMFSSIKTVDIINILLDNFNIGKELNFVPDYYVSRKLFRILIRLEALKGISDEIFLIENCNSKYETLLMKHNLTISYLDQIDYEEINNCHIIISKEHDKEKTEKLFKLGRVVHHLVCFNDEHLEWKRSSENITNIRKYKEIYRIGFECNNFFSNPVTLISAGPGMGKSMLLDYIAQETSTDKWVLRIDLNKHQNYFEDCKCGWIDANAIEHFKYFYTLSETELNNTIFQKFVKSKNVVILLDGFDEISILYKEEVTNIAKSFIEDDFSTYITTRPIMRSHLEDELNTFALILSPLTETNKEEFLMKYLNQCNTDHLSKCKSVELLNKFVTELLIIFTRKIAQINFTTTPLHIKLLAEYFSEDYGKYLLNESEINLNREFDLLDLYNHFIEKKIKILCDRYGSGLKELRFVYKDYYSLCALKLLFPLYKRTIDEYLGNSSNNADNQVQLLQKDGILTMDEYFNVGFSHRTFAEYLAAEWLSINARNKKENVKAVVKVLFSQRFNGGITNSSEYTFLFDIFDRILTKGINIHSSLINGLIDEVTNMVNVDSVKVCDKAGRSIIHLLAMYGRRYSSLLSTIEKLPDDTSELATDMLEYSPLDYALINNLLNLGNLICQKWKNSKININLDFKLQRRYLNWASDLNYESLFDTILTYAVYKNIILKNLSIHDNIYTFFVKFIPDGFLNKYQNINAGELPNLEMYKKDSKLSYEVIFGTEESVKKFLEENGNVNARDADGKTPLHYAVLNDKPEIMKLLLSSGANVNMQALFTAAPIYCVPNNRQHGFEVIKDDNGNTPLHYAIQYNKLEIINLLLRNRANTNVRNLNSKTSLHYAVRDGSVEVVDRLLQHKADINARDHKGNTSLHIALLKHKQEIVRLLLTKHADTNIRNLNGDTVLHIGSQIGNPEFVSEMLSRKADINIPNARGDTPLHIALSYRKLDTFRCLLSEGADVNKKNNNREVPLHLAVEYCDSDVLSKLLSYHTDINLQNIKGNAPLHFASRRGNLEVVDLLLSSGANINLKNFYKKHTPLHYCIIFDHFKMAKELISHKADVNALNALTGTALHYATLNNRCDLVHLLLANNADMNIKTAKGHAPLHYAVRWCDLAIVQKMLLHKADINILNTVKETPLHIAVFFRKLETIELLLTEGADVNIKTTGGCTAFDYAVKAGNSKIIEIFKTHKPEIKASDNLDQIRRLGILRRPPNIKNPLVYTSMKYE